MPVAGIPGAGLLPLDLGRQPGSGPGGVRLGFEEGDVLDGFVVGQLLDMTEPDPGGPVGSPELRCNQTGPLPVLPTGRRPPARLAVAAIGDELMPVRVGHRHRADPEGRYVDGVCGAFVVQCERFVRQVDSESERSARHQHRRTGDPVPPDGSAVPEPSSGGPLRKFSACSMVSSCWFS